MDFIWFSSTSLFVTELLYIRVCRLPSIDAEGLLWIGELISHKFIQWFYEELVLLFVTYYLCGIIKRVQTLRGFFIYDFTLSVRTLPTFEACVFIM